MDGHHKVVPSSVWRRHTYRQGARTPRVEKHTVRIITQPALGAPRLLRTGPHGRAEPTLPVDFERVLRLQRAVLIREDDYVVAHHNQEIADFLVAPLVTKRARVTPQREKVLLAKSLEVPLGLSDPRRLPTGEEASAAFSNILTDSRIVSRTTNAAAFARGSRVYGTS